MLLTNKSVVEKINASFVNNNTDEFLAFCMDDISWNITGYKELKGKEAIKNFMHQCSPEAPAFNITNIIAENNIVVCYGDMQMKNKDGLQESFSFCDIYNFSNNKVASIKTLMVKHSS